MLPETQLLSLVSLSFQDQSQPARGSVRPVYEVDPLLVLASGLKRFGPFKRGASRVLIRLTPIDPRVDPAGDGAAAASFFLAIEPPLDSAAASPSSS